MKKIVINIIATNKYIDFLDGVIKSIDSFFFLNSSVSVLVHTNMDVERIIEKNSKSRLSFLVNKIDHEPWPFTTLKRFHYFLSKKEEILNNDFSFYIDADSLFVASIEEDILPGKGMIGTIHPALFSGPGTPDRNPDSTAFIPHGENNRYFCGGFFGGDSESFLSASNSIKKNIELDLSKNVMAIWHDESHLNKYFFENPPAVILDNHFSAAEEQMHIYPNAKVCFLDKSRRGGHHFFRNS